MNRRVSKRINKQALIIATDWLKSMLPEEEAAKVKDDEIPRQNHTVYKDAVSYSIPFSYRGAKQIIKRLIRRNPSLVIENITKQDIAIYQRQVGRP
jgi:hypothetical protein